MKKNEQVAITGVCGGIGRSLAQGFIKKGYSIIGIDVNQNSLNEMEKQFSGSFQSYYADLLDREQRLAVAEKIFTEAGIPDIWINNAGIAFIENFLETPKDEFDKVIELNMLSYIDFTRYWLEKMTGIGSGTIVNMASCAGHIPAPKMSSYNASKYAVVGFTESMQQELKYNKSPVKLVLVSPGFVNTEIVKLGQENGFPEKIAFLLESAQSCSVEIIEGVLKGKSFISPTINGKILLGLNRLSPELCKSFSKFLIAPDIKTLFRF